ncbi:MAG: hypothetical protein HRT72_04350 [Flavobacteriales bacterium]|nr:hypothetical protein [Flavobacteriales bacterium]
MKRKIEGMLGSLTKRIYYIWPSKFQVDNLDIIKHKMMYKYLLSGMLILSIALSSITGFGQAVKKEDVYLTVYLKKTSYKKPLELIPDYFRGLVGVKELSGDRELIYIYGTAESQKEAKKILKEVGKAGFTTHRVMGVKNGKEIDASQAESIIEEQKLAAESFAANTDSDDELADNTQDEKPAKEKKVKEEKAPKEEKEPKAAKGKKEKKSKEEDYDAGEDYGSLDDFLADDSSDDSDYGSLEDIASSEGSEENNDDIYGSLEDIASSDNQGQEEDVYGSLEDIASSDNGGQQEEDFGSLEDIAPASSANQSDEEEFGSLEDIAPAGSQQDDADEFGSLEDIAPAGSQQDDADEFGSLEDIAPAAATQQHEEEDFGSLEDIAPATSSNQQDEEDFGSLEDIAPVTAKKVEENYGSLEDIAPVASKAATQSDLTDVTPSITKMSEPSKPQFDNKVYIGDEDKYYIQKSLPMYLYFATSPGGEMHNLKSRRTAEYANPMYLDSEGLNTFRSPSCVDPNTLKTVYPLKDIVFEVYADGLAPRTLATFSGATKYTYRGNIFYSGGLSVKLKSNDGMSGLDQIHYALNGDYKTYLNDLNFDSDGTNTLHFFSNDNVGNSEKTHSMTFTVDASAPTSAYAITGPSYQGNIIGPKSKFKLSSSDKLSGTRGIYYSYDGGNNRTFGKSAVSPNFLKDGEHTLTYYAVDRVKNAETKRTFNFYLDKMAPKVTTEIEGDMYKGKYTYVSPRSKVVMTATDNKAGVESIDFNVDGTGVQLYNGPISVPDRKGLHYISNYATDNVENRSGKKTKTVYMDNKAPATGIVYGDPQFFARDTLFICERTKIKLAPKDFESGVKNTQYALDGGSFQDYDVFTIKNEGFHTIQFKATDRVNNEEQQKESNTFVDNTGPVIYSNFSINSIGTKKKKGKTLKVYPNYTRLYIGATDAHVGTKTIFYSLDNGATFRDYSSPHTLDISELSQFKKNKFYSVIIKTKDMLDNESTSAVEFFVGDKGD